MVEHRDTHELERALFALGPRLAFPAEPDLSGLVAAEIRRGPERARRRVMPSWRPAVALGAVLVAIMAGLLTFSPATREAVADWIGLDGVRITFGDTKKAPLAEDLLLGEPMSLAEASGRVDFEIEVLGALGAPDEVYVQSDRPGGRVALVYEATDELPRTDETGVGALFSQFEAVPDIEVIQKKVMVGDSFVEPVEVAGVPGYWLGGGPHVVDYVDAEGEARTDQVRLAGNTLLWQRDGIVYRLETALSKTEAIGLAESSTPGEPSGP